ncbi:hypothetical protein Tco_0777370 [Tanacetum coccineum]
MLNPFEVCHLSRFEICEGFGYDSSSDDYKEDVVATKFMNNPRPDKMDIESDCSTPTLCSNEKEKNVIKEPQNKDTKFTPPLEEVVSPNCTALAADVEGVGVSRNVRRRLLASHSSMTMNANMISETAELHVGPAYIIENRDTADRNSVPISRVFDHFRNMRMDNIGLDSIRKRPLSTTPLPYASVDRRETPTTITKPVIAAINVRRCLTAGRSDDPVNASRLLTPSKKRVSATTIIKNHDITHGTIIPISKIFDGFRNMGNAAFQPLKSKVPNPVNNYTMQCPMLTSMSYSYDFRGRKRQADECLGNDEPKHSFPLTKVVADKITNKNVASDKNYTNMVTDRSVVDNVSSRYGREEGLAYLEKAGML